MESSIKQWHKSLLFSCVALALVVQAGPSSAQPTGYWNTMNYVMNKFTPGVDDVYLTGVDFWTHPDEENLNYELAVYHDFAFDGDYGTASDLGSWMSGQLTGTGEHTVMLPNVALRADEDYYVVLGLSGVQSPQFGYVAGDSGYYSSDYVFRSDPGGSDDWEPMLVTWAITPITTNQGPDDNIEVTDEAGNWQITREEFVAPATLEVDISATDHGPYDTEITVTGDMNPIILDSTVTNNSGVAWLDGYYLQLGYGLGEDFELATDGLAFDAVGGPHELFFADPIDIGEPVSVDGGFPINMGDHNVFTLRQFAVPEPSSFVLLALSGLALLAMGRRRR